MEEAVQWEHYKFNAGLFGQKTEYMGQPDKMKNDMWLDIVEREFCRISLVRQDINKLQMAW